MEFWPELLILFLLVTRIPNKNKPLSHWKGDGNQCLDVKNNNHITTDWEKMYGVNTSDFILYLAFIG